MGAGVRQCDVVAAIYSAQIRGTEEFGGDYPSIAPMLPAGEMAGAPHLTWSDERYPENIVVAIEIAGCYRRYHSPLARTVCIGSPNPKVADVAKIAVEGLEAALSTVKPGIYLEEMELAFRNVLKKNGLEKESRIGYSMGLNYPPDWGEHTASIRAGDKTILQPNMTFHCIPGMFSPTEASAVSVLYALILEVFIFKSLKLKDMPKIALSTGTVTATVFILVAAGQAFSWIVSFAGIPQMMASGLIGPETSKYAVFAIISISLFVACMFVDSIPVILILTPIFYPIAMKVGIDPVHLGILVTLQAAIGAITPPFGCNIFTASAIFDKPFFTVIKGLTPYIIMFTFTTIVLIYFPQLALFLKDLAFPPTM